MSLTGLVEQLASPRGGRDAVTIDGPHHATVEAVRCLALNLCSQIPILGDLRHIDRARHGVTTVEDCGTRQQQVHMSTATVWYVSRVTVTDGGSPFTSVPGMKAA